MAVLHSPASQESSADFFKKITFSKKFFQGSKHHLDPYQDQQNVGPDLGPDCSQRLSADDKSIILLARKE